MFEGKVNLIKRNKLFHCGVKMWNGSECKIASVCSGIWSYKDVVTEGDALEVTCKKCRKILEKSDSEGVVQL